MAMKVIPLVEEERNGLVENIHYGSICILDREENVVYAVGDCSEPVFLRSAAKPFQALPTYLSNVQQIFNLTDKEMTILMGSHRGEPEHLEVLTSIQKKLAIAEQTLICGVSYPLNETPKHQWIASHLPKRKLIHNCSGKHFGLLAYTKAKGEPIDSYAYRESSVLQEVEKIMSHLAGLPIEKIHFGVDGCGLPNYALPLPHIARAFLKLAVPEQLEEIQLQEAIQQMTKNMNDYPAMVASHDFICTELLKDRNIVAKGGAQGVYGLALKKEGIAISLKVKNGSEEIWALLIYDVLKKLGYQQAQTFERLEKIARRDILNDSGQIVGKRKVVIPDIEIV